MHLNRRDFIRSTVLLTAALGVKLPDFLLKDEAHAGVGDLPVVWFQAQSCSGCSVSFLNSVYFATVDDLLLNTLDVKYHPSRGAGINQLLNRRWLRPWSNLKPSRTAVNHEPHERTRK